MLLLSLGLDQIIWRPLLRPQFYNRAEVEGVYLLTAGLGACCAMRQCAFLVGGVKKSCVLRITTGTESSSQQLGWDCDGSNSNSSNASHEDPGIERSERGIAVRARYGEKGPDRPVRVVGYVCAV